MNDRKLLAKILLSPDEKILLLVRSSWLRWFWPLFLAVVFILAAFFLMFYLFHLGQLGIAGFAILLFAGLLLIWRVCRLHYWNAFIMTDKKLIDIDRSGFLRRSVLEQPLSLISEVTSDSRGLGDALTGLGGIKIKLRGGSVVYLVKIRRADFILSLIVSELEKYLRAMGKEKITA